MTQPRATFAHQAGQLAALLGDRLGRPQGRGPVLDVGQQNLGEAQDRRERRLELVGDQR